ncbi:MAG: hypothetical protein WEA54_00635, partial [Actinomycetota bacterium]
CPGNGDGNHSGNPHCDDDDDCPGNGDGNHSGNPHCDDEDDDDDGYDRRVLPGLVLALLGTAVIPVPLRVLRRRSRRN